MKNLTEISNLIKKYSLRKMLGIFAIKEIKNRKCLDIFCFMFLLCLLTFNTLNSYCEESALKVKLTVKSARKGVANVIDGKDATSVKLKKGDKLTFSGNADLSQLYIKWNANPKKQTLTYDDKTIDIGTEGFVHEYINLENSVTSFVINIESETSLSEVIAYSEGELPSEVQIWEAPCDRAEILAFVAHADDEILYLGGALAEFGVAAGNKVQVVHLCDFFKSNPVREHEKLDGLWELGIKNYPINAGYTDHKMSTFKEASKVYKYSDVVDYCMKQIETFKPHLVITQDLKGEYGHGAHILLAKAVCEAVETVTSATYSNAKHEESSVQKLYLHLYEKNPITLDLHNEMSLLGNRTPLQAAIDAYKKHLSQHSYSYEVSDDYKYSCARFGLYYTNVGYDRTNNMLENIKTYNQLEQEELERQAQLESESESESLAQNEEEKLTIANLFTHIDAKLFFVVIFLIIAITSLIIKIKE